MSFGLKHANEIVGIVPFVKKVFANITLLAFFDAAAAALAAVDIWSAAAS